MNSLVSRLVLALSLVFVGIALLSVTTSHIAADSIVGEVIDDVVEPVDDEQAQLERDFLRLQREHRDLLRWVTELRPWLIHTAYKQSAALPHGVPTPSLEPLPPVPSPSPTPIPSPPIPTPSVLPTPSLCLPLVCEETPSVEVPG